MGTFFTNSYFKTTKTWYKGSNYVHLEPETGTVGISLVIPNTIINDASPQIIITDYPTDTLTINDKLVLEQPMQTLNINTYVQGTAITFGTQVPFTAADGITLVDPDQVLFGFIINNDPTEVYTFTYTQGTGDPTGTIVRDSLGSYHATIDTLVYTPGVWVYSFAGRPSTSVNLDTTKTEVRAEAQCVVDAPSFLFPS